MTIPGLPPSVLPDAPPPMLERPPIVDPPLLQALPDGRIIVFPMTYPAGWGQGFNTTPVWDDATQLNQACLQAGPGGHVHLVNAAYNIYSQWVILGATPTTPGQQVSGKRGTIIYSHFGGAASNTGAAVSCHGSEVGASEFQGYGTIIERLIIDGSNVPGTTISSALDYGDQYSGVLQDLVLQNFTSSGKTTSTGSNPLGAVGLNLNNQVSLTEKLHVQRVTINNCGTPNATSSPNQGGGAAIQLVQTTGVNASWQYSRVSITVNTQPHQNGLVMARNGNLTNFVLFEMRGNFNCDSNPANCASIVVGVANPGGGAAQNAQGFNCELNIDVESDGGSGGTSQPITIAFGTNVGNTLTTMRGRCQWSYLNGWQAASGFTVTPSGQWQYSGRLHGDGTLFSGASPYAGGTLTSGTVYTNNGVDAWVTVSGGTVSAVAVGGINPGLTSGTFIVPMNQTFSVTFSAAPVVTWMSALAN